jgi:H+/Cl- antiporter ClcA
VFWGGAVLVGMVGVAFAVAANRAQAAFGAAAARHAYLPLLVTPLGFAASALLCRVWFPGSEGSGIPQAIAARVLRGAAEREALLGLRVALGKVALTLLGLASGASIGREGPTVQVGAAIMLRVARFGDIGGEPGLILAGSAAGVAAAFNTPLAGIVFAIEEMSRAFESRTSFLVLTCVVLAGIASFGLTGDYSYFGTTTAALGGPADWLAVPLCGVVGGAAGALFSRLLLAGSARLAALLKTAPLSRLALSAGLAGLAVAAIGVLSGGSTFGTGYEVARGAVQGAPVPWGFAPLKLAATLLSSLAGIPGGIFAPSLSVGAGIGAALQALLPRVAGGALAVLAMGGYFAGVVQAPITAFVIITEMTAGHALTLPLMASSLLGYATSRLLAPEALYHALADRYVAAGGGRLPDEAADEG